MDKRKILIQLDSDTQPSVFDRVVAVDAGADEVFSYGGVQPEQVRDLVHGAIFTRGAQDLRSTAIFIGGSDVTAGERLVEEVRKHLLPQYGLSVSLLLDANGANTTAAAAVRLARQQLTDLSRTPALVLGGTGPVGQRVALLLARESCPVRVGSRQLARATAVCERIRAKYPQITVDPVAISGPDDLTRALAERVLVVAAGAAGIQLLPKPARLACKTLRLAIDLNAVPPLGIEGVEVADKAVQRDGMLCYGAVGVGGTKMKIHKAAIAQLFQANDQVLDAEQVYDLALRIG